ncbi:NAD(P)H-dependent oxidoreductase [Nakamurella flavida]|uniref:NAD(P)H-dependent oxidoreductase n=1 Tax=Nakamurella flavida TaxID=363630 RepID=A0A938YFG5_9ACTN|nr:NAD(P)H-dependent oxidoreductase [Nakamurella flavida]MBM9476706.1 NAD(P)H-dependent oxidoreductase [Nakamurella flavida]MDP9778856.1 FMN reductase [Nakamurella flavida]
MSEPRIVAVVGNPKVGSRTLGAATALADQLAAVLDVPPGDVEVVDLATLAPGLLAPWSLSPEAAQASAHARAAELLIMATPTYKASFTGLLKLFLDTLPADALSGTVVVPLTTSAGPAHRHLADLQLRPVLAELGAVVPTPSVLVAESEIDAVGELVATWVERHRSVVSATMAALR